MEALLHFSLYFTQTNTGGMLPCACRLMVYSVTPFVVTLLNNLTLPVSILTQEYSS
jgi:hypothetical protein